MYFNSQEVKIRPTKFSGRPCLHFTFHGKLTEQNANNASEFWQDYLASNPSDSYTFVWDCEEMSGFELSARKVWYQYMKENKNQISSVIVISGSILIRSAARVMLEFFGIPGKILKHKEKLQEIDIAA